MAELDTALRQRIISDPDVVLEDRDLMRALAEADGGAMGSNVVDIRGVAIERLEARLDRLEDTHRSVIAAAYDNLAGTNQIHRAVLRMLEAPDFDAFVDGLSGTVSEILRVDAARLVLETLQDDPTVDQFDGVLQIMPVGTVTRYMGPADRPVVLRQVQAGDSTLYGDRSGWIRSEACLRLNLGRNRLPAMLAMGSEDPHMFRQNHGTDLLAFFAGVFERTMQRWLN